MVVPQMYTKIGLLWEGEGAIVYLTPVSAPTETVPLDKTWMLCLHPTGQTTPINPKTLCLSVRVWFGDSSRHHTWHRHLWRFFPSWEEQIGGWNSSSLMSQQKLLSLLQVKLPDLLCEGQV